jgi:hypothetical protein
MKKLFFTIFLTAIIFSGCKRNDDISGSGYGKLIINVTDDPFNIDFVESATVTITKVEIRKAGENEENPFIVLSEDTVTFDLMALRNGITAELLNLEIPAGDYNLIRLYVEEASLKLKGRTEEFNVKVPGGHHTGIKIFIHPAIHVEDGLSSELLLDFDLSKSFVMRGNMHHHSGVTGFIFKPCIRASDISVAGRISGFVSDTAKVLIPNAKVWVEKDSVIATSFTDTLGHYALIGIPSGTYSVSATRENYDTVSFDDIKVYAGNRTFRDFILTPTE